MLKECDMLTAVSKPPGQMEEQKEAGEKIYTSRTTSTTSAFASANWEARTKCLKNCARPATKALNSPGKSSSTRSLICLIGRKAHGSAWLGRKKVKATNPNESKEGRNGKKLTCFPCTCTSYFLVWWPFASLGAPGAFADHSALGTGRRADGATHSFLMMMMVTREGNGPGMGVASAVCNWTCSFSELIWQLRCFMIVIRHAWHVVAVVVVVHGRCPAAM